MNHSFNIKLATKYGVEEAIIIENLAFWINKNAANNKNNIEGYYWTYNSSKAFKELFPYISEKKIQRILKKLEELKIVKSGNFNKSSYDRTKWYTITDKSIRQIYTIHLPKLSNGLDTSVQPIPDINTDIKKDINTDTSENKFSQEIVDIMELFSQINPSIQYGNKTQRKACEDMLKRFGYENTIKMVKQVLGVQGNKYAPTATTPYTMYQKLADFKVYFDKQKTNDIVLDLTKEL
jgi:DNA-binding transcriptional regulator GbsR (MarR family)